VVAADTWAKVQVRMQERATGTGRGGGVRRYLLSGLLVCERCGGRFVCTGKNGSHYTCSTHSQGGESACPIAGCISRPLAESIILEPIQRDLLAPEAVECACQLIGKWVREESAQIATGASPALDSIAAEIEDMEALIDARPARAGTLRPIVEELRARQAKLRRAARQEEQAKLALEISAEEGYRTAVAQMAGVLQGSNIEAARAALRSLIGSIPVFEDAGQLYGRIGLNPMPLFQPRNPQTFGGMVAGASYHFLDRFER
jgi:hypothetical protein